jgi:hypothetical protein
MSASKAQSPPNQYERDNNPDDTGQTMKELTQATLSPFLSSKVFSLHWPVHIFSWLLLRFFSEFLFVLKSSSPCLQEK